MMLREKFRRVKPDSTTRYSTTLAENGFLDCEIRRSCSSTVLPTDPGRVGGRVVRADCRRARRELFAILSRISDRSVCRPKD